jgi:hypothetical protein
MRASGKPWSNMFILQIAQVGARAAGRSLWACRRRSGSIIDEMRRPASPTEYHEISNDMRAHHEVRLKEETGMDKKLKRRRGDRRSGWISATRAQ